MHTLIVPFDISHVLSMRGTAWGRTTRLYPRVPAGSKGLAGCHGQACDAGHFWPRCVAGIMGPGTGHGKGVGRTKVRPSRKSSLHHLRYDYLAGAITLLAAFLRFYALDKQGLWNDEGISYVRGILPLDAMPGRLPVEQMPLYYVLLSIWMRVVGQSVLTMRVLSVLPGIALVPLSFYVGRRWFGRGVGLVGMLLAALSPLLIHQSQIMRMYSLVTLLLLLSVAFADRVLEHGSSRSAFGYSVSAAAALMTHGAAALGIAILNLWAMWAYRERRETLRRWLWLQAWAALVPIAWFLGTLGLSGREEMLGAAGGSFPGLLRFALDTASVLVSAPYDPPAYSEALWSLPLAGLAWLGAGAATGANLTHRRWLVGGLPLLQAGLSYLLGVVLDAPVHVYYLAPVVPLVYLAAALGLSWLHRRGRWFSALGLVVALGAMVGNLGQYHHRTVEDIGPLARRIAREAGPGDAIVLNSIWRAQCFEYYDHSGLPTYAEPDRSQVSRIVQGHDRVWVLLFGRLRNRALSEGLMSQAFEVNRWTSGTTELRLYLTSAAPQGVARPLRARFGEAIELLGYDLSPEVIPSGSLLQLTLWWRAAEPVSGRYKVFTHLVGAEGHIWGQHDGEPANGTRPTSGWDLGQLIRDPHALRVEPGTLPGEYRLMIGLYDGLTGQRLPVVSDEGVVENRALAIADVRVSAAPRRDLGSLAMQHRVDLSLPGGLRLLGYDVHVLGREVECMRFEPGGFVHLRLFWMTPPEALEDHTLAFELLDARGVLQSRVSATAQDALAPCAVWPPGSLVLRQHNLAVPAATPPGEYDLFLTVRDALGQEVAPRLQLGPITVFAGATSAPAGP